VLSEMLRHVLSAMPLSCYQKSKYEFLARIVGKFRAPNSSNPEKKSFGFLITATESVDNRLGRVSLPAQKSPRQSELNSVSVDTREDLHVTKFHSRVRPSLTGIAETGWTPLRCERGHWRRGRTHLIELLPIADVPLAVRCCSPSEESRRGEDVRSRWNACVTRCGGLSSPRAMRVGVSTRPKRERRMDAEARCNVASLEHVTCRRSRFPPIGEARAARRRAT
jgi:hypothetical protein